jgi:hypothetical protein
VAARQRYHHVWTTADELVLREGYLSGDPVQEIARRIGATPRAVEGRAQKVGILHRNKARALRERFWDKTTPVAGSECVLWTGSKNAKGYGRVRDGKCRLATHVALELHGLIVPPDLEVLHTCDTPACVNVEHLFVGTHLDNMRDCRRKGRLAAMGGRKGQPVLDSQCINGHPLEGVNLYVAPSGAWFCRLCRALNARAFRARVRGSP